MTWLQKRMQIVQEMRGALRDVVDARASSEATTQARVLSQEQYQAEVVRLENQHSTTFQVRESQRDLFQAEDVETAAITQYEILRASLERARGTLAQEYGVHFELEPETLRPHE
jgi:outer membrane protein TolC